MSLAIKTGLSYVRTPYVVVMDSDYTYPAIHNSRSLYKNT